ncbi:capsule assembly Wzi family protein [Spirosoma sp. RP8]|uniref:Capsule assembly Wzi family protein n=1 Tax=Spirosoma liriopis TaxID=2937440 RepID=A0ABT0HT79_9BACT|nr:capsule assembly Wzi family protein [Spirosoma liriopis]MCK8495376.1 capsule assembly Wzi family protein [Spirosoma liriopis]
MIPLLASPADSLKGPNRLPSKSNLRWTIPTPSLVQSRTIPSRWGGFVEAGGLASSSGVTPFWMQTNQYGVVPKATPTGLIRLNVNRSYGRDSLTNRRKTDLGYGVELAGQVGQVNQLLVVEAYVKARWGIAEIFAGRRRQRVGLAESALSSGSYIWSGNTLPIPQVQIGFPEYVPIGFTKGWVALKGFIGHGWFGDDGYVRGSYLHHKAIFVRLGRPQAKVQFYGAFTHFAQWGGYAPFLEQDPTSSFNGQIAQSWDAFVNVVLPFKTDALKDRTKFTTFDQNRVGDHRGTAEVAVDIKLAQGTLRAYQQHFYDLGRKLYNFRNIEDGLYGLRYVRDTPKGFLREAVLELFNSGNQGVLQFGRSLGGEAENYFLNGQYPASWSYQGRTIGTPFITQSSDAASNLPRIPFSGYTADNQLIEGVHGTNNNRVWALYGALSGRLSPRWAIESKVSFSRNYGTFSSPFPAGTDQWSALGSLVHSGTKGTQVLVSLGYDQGRLLANPQQIGGYLGLRKYWRHLP